jgi:hypothetical protein
MFANHAHYASSDICFHLDRRHEIDGSTMNDGKEIQHSVRFMATICDPPAEPRNRNYGTTRIRSQKDARPCPRRGTMSSVSDFNPSAAEAARLHDLGHIGLEPAQSTALEDRCHCKQRCKHRGSPRQTDRPDDRLLSTGVNHEPVLQYDKDLIHHFSRGSNSSGIRAGCKMGVPKFRPRRGLRPASADALASVSRSSTQPHRRDDCVNSRSTQQRFAPRSRQSGPGTQFECSVHFNCVERRAFRRSAAHAWMRRCWQPDKTGACSDGVGFILPAG